MSTVTINCLSNNVSKKFDRETLKNECFTISNMIEDVDMDECDDREQGTVIVLPETVEWSMLELNFLSSYIHNRKYFKLDPISKPLYVPLKNVLPVADNTLIETIDCKETLERLITMANYLQCDGLLSILCARVAEMIKKMSHKEILVFFELEDDLNDQDREKIKNENVWFDEDYYHDM